MCNKRLKGTICPLKCKINENGENQNENNVSLHNNKNEQILEESKEDYNSKNEQPEEQNKFLEDIHNNCKKFVGKNQSFHTNESVSRVMNCISDK